MPSHISFIHHITLEMPFGGDSLARQFYAGLLGLTEIEIPETLRDHEGGSVWFAMSANQQLHLGPVKAFSPQRRAHVAFQVADLALLQFALRQANTRLQTAKQEHGWLRFYAFDPFGNKLEFRQRIQPEKEEALC